MRCYSEAADRGYQHFFRMDDDYIPGVFYQLEKQLDVDINDIIEQAHRCLLELNVSYVGFMNTKNPRELRPSFSKTHGHLAGAAVMAISTKTPETFMSLDPDLAGVHEDLYRTCAHRRYERDVLGGRGENGRVNFIGATWAGCFGKNTSIVSTQEGIYRSENFLSQEFPDMITFIDGSEYVNVLGFEKRKKRYLKSW
jgi:hypothetical protein